MASALTLAERVILGSNLVSRRFRHMTLMCAFLCVNYRLLPLLTTNLYNGPVITQARCPALRDFGDPN